MAQQVKKLTNIPEDLGLIPGLAQWVEDLALLWLWHRPAAAALIHPLGWEPPYAMGVALKRQEETKKKKLNVELPFVAQWLTNPSRIHEDAGSTPGLAQWVRDLTLLVVWVTDLACIPHCCGCGVDQQL